MVTSLRPSRSPVARALMPGGLALMLSLGACASEDASTAGGLPKPGPRVNLVRPEQWPTEKSPFTADPALDARVREILGSLSVEEKVGQIVQADIGSITPDDVRTYRLGSVLAGGNSDPHNGRIGTPQEWLALADAFYAAAMDTSNGHHAVPLLFGIDAVHGHNNVIGATLYPHNIGLGATRDPELIGRIAAATAVELRVTGMDWTFAPTLTVPRDDRWGRTYEGYSEDPRIVSSYAAAVVEGLQGKVGSAQFLDGNHVISAAKHFLGDGATHEGKDQGDAKISEAELRDVHGSGYPPAIAAGVQTVMASFSSWNGEKMHGNRALLTDVLKGRMGFEGFVVGDWNAHGQVTGCSNVNCAAAFNAGIDMLMTPDSWRGYYTHALAQVRSGEIPMARLDDAVSRILRVKLRLHLFEAGKPSQRPPAGRFELIGSAEHRALAREAVRKSLVLLKNDNGVLPVSPKARVLVAGDGADSVARQSGGWTLTWQGTGTTPAQFPNAQTIWSGVNQQVAAAGGTAELSATGNYSVRPDVAIVVFGEDPYAEFQGDLLNLQFKSGDSTNLDLIRRLKADGVPVVAVFLSGRPLWVNREINAADAFVAAWLPGSEGGGIADVLLRKADGAVAYDFSGKLSYSWPRTATQTPLNIGQDGYDPQFTLGYGLTYADSGELAPLPEASGVSGKQGPSGEYFARGELAPGWSLTIGAASTDATHDVAITPVDHHAQEDARRLLWSGKGQASVRIASDQPLDLGRETNGDVLLLVTIKVDTVPAGEVSLLACDDKCKAHLPLREFLAGLAPGVWTDIGVPLKCLRAAGADPTKLVVPFGLETSVALDVSISRVALGTEAEHKLSCPTD